MDKIASFTVNHLLLLPGVLPFENCSRGINLSYSENNSNVKFGTIPFIQKDYINTKINILENADTIIKTIDMLDNLSTTKIEQNKDTNSRQINILFDNICDLVNSESLREKYDKYNPSSFNNNALFMFSDLGLATNYAKLDNVNIDAQNYPLYVYTNTFIGSAFATLQDVKTVGVTTKDARVIIPAVFDDIFFPCDDTFVFFYQHIVECVDIVCEACKIYNKIWG